MIKTRGTVALAIGLFLAPSWQAQENWRNDCIRRCVTQPMQGDPEGERQEIVSLEREAGHAIQLGSGTFFHRIYSDDFTGALSHGQLDNKDQWIAAVESPNAKPETLILSDTKVRMFQETAIATCLVPTRFNHQGQAH